MTTIDGNPYARPESDDHGVPESDAEAQYPRKALRIAGAVMAFSAVRRGFQLVTSTADLLRIFGRGMELLTSSTTWFTLVPGVIGLTIPALLAISLLRGKARYRKLAWIFVVAGSALSIATQILAQAFGRQDLPLTFVVALSAQKTLFPLAIALLLVGRAGPSRVVAGTVMGVLYVVSVFGMHFL